MSSFELGSPLALGATPKATSVTKRLYKYKNNRFMVQKKHKVQMCVMGNST